MEKARKPLSFWQCIGILILVSMTWGWLDDAINPPPDDNLVMSNGNNLNYVKNLSDSSIKREFQAYGMILGCAKGAGIDVGLRRKYVLKRIEQVTGGGRADLIEVTEPYVNAFVDAELHYTEAQQHGTTGFSRHDVEKLVRHADWPYHLKIY